MICAVPILQVKCSFINHGTCTACTKVTVVCLCVCVCICVFVTELAATYIVCTLKSGALQSSLSHFEHFQHVDLAEDALFKS